MNELYKKLVEKLYETLPEGLKNVIEACSPESLVYSRVKNVVEGVPYLNEFLYGASYAPHTVLTYVLTNNLLRIKEEDISEKDLEEVYEIGPIESTVFLPAVEEFLLRFVPSQLSRLIGGDVGEMVVLGASSFLFALGHLYKYKRKKIRGFVTECVPSLFLYHTYLLKGFFASWGLHSAVNGIGRLLRRL